MSTEKRVEDKFPDVSTSWEAGREAMTLDEAKELAGMALAKLGLPEPTWYPSVGSVSPWEYADVEVGRHEKLVVGASSGGVVSISGDPFTPDKREANVTLARVLESLNSICEATIDVLEAPHHATPLRM